MTELLFNAITGPESGESIKWWQLAYKRSVEDFADGAKSRSTLFIGTTDEGFTPKTNSNLTIAQDIDRIFGPVINTKWDPVELGIENDPNAVDLTEQFTIDIANTMTTLTLQIEGQDIPISDGFRIGEGPFKFEVVEGNALVTSLDEGEYTKAFADGYFYGVETSLLPSIPINIMSGGVFQLGSLPEVAEDNPLKGTYDGYREVGDLPINQNFNIEFDLNVVSGTNKKDILIGTRLRDELIGGDNNDYLIAGLGNDYVSGGNGDDILNGTRRLAMGIGEIDVLEGGNGKDTFVLGKWNQAYYIGEGDLDYALIQDYNSKDTIWLGSDEFTLDSENYTFGGQTGTAILVDNDLVAFLVDVTPDMITI